MFIFLTCIYRSITNANWTIGAVTNFKAGTLVIMNPPSNIIFQVTNAFQDPIFKAQNQTTITNDINVTIANNYTDYLTIVNEVENNLIKL